MALQPSLQPLIVAGSADAPHTLDIFLDYVCVFSTKMALTIDKVLVIFRPHVQPWHASSTLVHEAGLAVVRVAPQQFWPFALAFFKQWQGEFSYIPMSTLTPLEVRSKLAKLAESVIGSSLANDFKDLLELKGPYGHNAVADDLKYTIKFSRQNSIHVSPTVLWDGLVANEISNSWGEKEWNDFLAAKVAV
ncbi:hypothetical protein EV361DRAFT_876215 [Lentinula raphanica]|nr:hypothetical protein EV361DRAFT_876215 [Lentinula raphanica]